LRSVFFFSATADFDSVGFASSAYAVLVVTNKIHVMQKKTVLIIAVPLRSLARNLLEIRAFVVFIATRFEL